MDKEGTIQKETLINIIKVEFELTIDMVVSIASLCNHFDVQDYLRKISQDDEIDYYDFCQLLDAGTSGNPSRVSSYLSNNKGSSFMRFSYFERNLDKMSFF
jgi:hypothetical protein